MKTISSLAQVEPDYHEELTQPINIAKIQNDEGQELSENGRARKRFTSRHRDIGRLSSRYSNDEPPRELELSSKRVVSSHRTKSVDARDRSSGFPSSRNDNDGGFESVSSSPEASELSDEISRNDGENDDGSSKSDGYNSDDLNPLDNSPYPQVRASVPAVDDVSLSINTPRMWTLSMLFAVIGSSTNLFFSLRYPSVSITPIIALLLVHPLGILWDKLLKCPNDPKESYVHGNLARRAHSSDGRGYNIYMPQASASAREEAVAHEIPKGYRHNFRLWLAQGHWNEKEHTCVYISSNVSFGFAFATDVIVEQAKFYKQEVSLTYQILLTLSTQILGYAFAGLTRRYLVQPSGMIWPSTLVSSSLFSTLHKNENPPANRWHISPARFFVLIFAGSLAFYTLPGLLVPALSYFNVITWFAPDSVVIANLFGVSSGLGMFPMTFDWSQIAYIGSPLVVPFWAAVNVFGGLILVMWVVAPLLYYTNTFYSSYMPILSADVFDNTGKHYDVFKILTAEYRLDEDAYRDYSRVFLPITYVLSYALQFAGICALLSHTVCWHGRDIWTTWSKSLTEAKSQGIEAYDELSQNDNSSHNPLFKRRKLPYQVSPATMDNLLVAEDVHSRLMQRYRNVPIAWYAATGILTAGMAVFVVEYYPISLPWYGVLLAIGLSAILFIPIGIVMAITNQQSSTFLINQLLCGLIFPGRPIANMVFVTYGYITSLQGLKFTSDLKIGQYMKIPPRLLFVVQLLATIVSSFTQIGLLNWMLANIPDICTPEAMNGFTCPIAKVHYNGSILWGVIGPVRFFGQDALYRPLIWAFLVGTLAPVAVWTLGQRGNKDFWSKVNLPVIFSSLSWIPPASGLNFSVWAIVCFTFNHHIMRRYNDWWKKYNMTLSAALDSSVAMGVVIIFFGVLYPGLMSGFSWWGTEIYKEGCDWKACPFETLAPGETFGPKTW